MFPLAFRGEDNHEETRVMGLLCGQSCMILISTVLTDPPVWQTDRRTDRQTDRQPDGWTADSILHI